jgi:hypothetical protein
VFRTSATVIVLGAVVATGCRHCRDTSTERDREQPNAGRVDEGEGEGEDDEEKEEEAERHRLNYWRVEVAIVGRGIVQSSVGHVACVSNGDRRSGDCGPELFAFEELEPPLLHARAALGWRLARWESSIRALDGTVRSRPPPMPDGDYYINGFGYTDTHELETVTAVFVVSTAAGP